MDAFVQVVASNDAIGSATFVSLYAGYYFYCFNLANSAFKFAPEKDRVQGACMDGVYTELRNVFEDSYPGINLSSATSST